MKKFLLLIGAVMVLYANQEKIVFAAGCFWGVEKHFSEIEGVIDVKTGYAGGNYPEPTYEKVLSYRKNPPKGIVNYTECVEVIFDNSKVDVEKLIKEFWQIHDPTQKNGQGNDIGNNYRSAIFYTNERQKEIAIKTKNIYQKLLTEAGYGKIVTQIEPLEKFYEAEEYHQDYLEKHPFGYCPNHSTGVKFSKKDKIADEKTAIINDKSIVIIVSKNCPYCEKFDKEVISDYKGDIPLLKIDIDRLKNYSLEIKPDATPMILFIENNKVNFSHKGYMQPYEFYKALGKFKLKEGSEAYNVAFNQGTDNRFCKKYEKYKDVKDGVFVDILSGEPLFDTKDRFNSHSGWLSFYKPVNGSVIYRDDYSFGMHRIEVIAKISGIHLGHVFDDAPNGKKRYCINASVVKFVPRK